MDYRSLQASQPPTVTAQLVCNCLVL